MIMTSTMYDNDSTMFDNDIYITCDNEQYYIR